jgi:Zn-dependent peptidase ImmA (M78 family)
LFVNGRDSKAAQTFTLAHELAHVFFGRSAAFDLRRMQPAKDPMEQACNRVAAEFLVPESELRQIWPSVQSDPEPFQAVAYQFKVSSLVAARRALDLSLITKDQFFNFYDSHLSHERRTSDGKRGGGNFYNNQNLRVGRRFAMEVANAAAEGRLLYSEAYHLTGLYGRTFHRYVDSIRMDGVQ